MYAIRSYYVLNRATGGWFWTYVYEIHQAHDFNRDRVWMALLSQPLGIAATGHVETSRAAAEILRSGGNAFDAAMQQFL